MKLATLCVTHLLKDSKHAADERLRFIFQGLSALHLACMYGQLAAVQLLVQSRPGLVDCSDSQGRRPIHMVLSSQSAPSTSACLRDLLEHEADVNA